MNRAKKLTLGLMATLSMTALTGCAEMERGMKDIDSSMGGLNRKVSVMSHTGEVIKEYEGKIDLETTSDGTVKFDLNKKRIMVKNAVVVIEEQ